MARVGSRRQGRGRLGRGEAASVSISVQSSSSDQARATAGGTGDEPRPSCLPVSLVERGLVRGKKTAVGGREREEATAVESRRRRRRWPRAAEGGEGVEVPAGPASEKCSFQP